MTERRGEKEMIEEGQWISKGGCEGREKGDRTVKEKTLRDYFIWPVQRREPAEKLLRGAAGQRW